MAKEQWRMLRGAHNYWVSNLGNVKGVRGLIKPYPNTSGYLQFRIYPDTGKPKKVFLHRVVAAHWVDNEHNFAFVHHKDGNPHNCAADNLEWVETRSHLDKKTAAQYSLNRKRRSMDVAQIDPATGDIIRIWSRESLKASTMYHWPYICRCCKIKTGGKYRGYIWKYAERLYQPSIFASDNI